MNKDASKSENKVFAMKAKEPSKSGRNHGNAWESGRDEVARNEGELPKAPFFSKINFLETAQGNLSRQALGAGC
jgi:hypothetical protein